jgi:type II secretory pathway component PulF
MSTMALFEPLVICLFGGVVMILVMAIYLPIISVSSAVK